MILDSVRKFDDLLADFTAARSLSSLDNAIIDHSIDGWPMTRLAKEHGTTPSALHRRRKELFTQFRDFLEGRGITGSYDVFET
jgi:hypothetical protein